MAELTMDRGEDRTVRFTFDGNSEFEAGDVVWFTVKRRLSDLDSAALVSHVSTNNGVTLNGGVATALIPAGATTALTGPTRLHYDWQLRTANGQVRTLDRGTIVVTPDVTQTTTTA